MKMKIVKLLVLFVLGAALIASTSWAFPILNLTDNLGNFVNVEDNSALDTYYDNGNDVDDIILFSGSLGGDTVWSVNVTSGMSPVPGSTATPHMDLLSLNVSSTGAGTLEIIFADEPDWSSGVSGLIFDVGGTTNGTASFETLIDSSSMSMLGPFGSGAFSGSDMFLGTGTEVQIVANITHTGAGQVTSFDAELSPIPEPATMFLLGTGLVGVAGAARRRKKNPA